jgi:hypothetical protein
MAMLMAGRGRCFCAARRAGDGRKCWDCSGETDTVREWEWCESRQIYEYVGDIFVLTPRRRRRAWA